MPDRSQAYFPLRSNAASLVTGRAINDMRRRIKRAALLHDEVILEAGSFDIHAGAGGSSGMWRPARADERWQTPRRRGAQQKSNFYVNFRLSDAPDDAPFHQMIHSAATIAWQATFEPFRRELPRGYRWLWFGHGDDHPVATREAGSIFNPDQRDESLKEQWPESFVRKAIITQTNLDLAMGARIGAAIAFDREHSSVIRARVIRGDAELVLGDRALQIVLSREPTWEDLADLRRSRGVRDYRAILREVEAAARDEVGSSRPLPEAIWREYTAQLERAASKRPSLTAKVSVGLVGAGSGVIAGVATGGAPIIGEIVGLAVGTVADVVAEHLSQPAWLSMDRTVRRGARRGRPSRLL